MKKMMMIAAAVLMALTANGQVIKSVTKVDVSMTKVELDTLRTHYAEQDAEYLLVLADLQKQLESDKNTELKKERTIYKSESSYLKSQQKNYKEAKKHLDSQKKTMKSEISTYEKEIKLLEKESKNIIKTSTDKAEAEKITTSYGERINNCKQEIIKCKSRLADLNTRDTERLKDWQIGLAKYESQLKVKDAQLKHYEETNKANLNMVKAEVKAIQAKMKGK